MNNTSELKKEDSLSNWLKFSIKIPERLRQRPFFYTGIALLKSFFIVVLPFVALLGLLNYFEEINLNEAKLQQQQNLTNLLSQIAGDSDPLRYFNKEFSNLSQLPFCYDDKYSISTFKIRVDKILAEFNSPLIKDKEINNEDTLSQQIMMCLYNKEGNLIKKESHWKTGDRVAKDLLRAVKDPSLVTKQSFAAGKINEQSLKRICGYTDAHLLMHNSPNSVVELGLSDENKWGGFFELHNEDGKISGYLIVFIKKDINSDFLLPKVLTKTKQQNEKDTLLAWQEPSQDIKLPNDFQPSDHGFSQSAINSINNMPLGENVVYIKEKNNKTCCGVKIFTDSGIRLIGELIEPAHADYIYSTISLILKSVFTFLLFLTVFFMLGLSSFVPGFRLKMAMLIIFGALVSLSMLLFTGLAYSNEIENNLKNDFQQAHVEEMTRIDEDILNDYGIIEREFGNDIHSISPSLNEEEMAEKAETVFASNIIQRSQKVFKPTVNDFKKKYPFIRKLIFATENKCLTFDELKDMYGFIKKPDKNSFEAYIMSLIQIANGESVSDEIANSGNVMSGMGNVLNTSVLLNTGKISNMNMVSSGLTYIDLLRDKNMKNRAILYIFMKDFMLQKSYLLKTSKKRDEQIKKSPLTPRFAAIPVSKTKDWRAFPNSKTANDSNLLKIADQAYKSMAPVHDVVTINNKRYLISSIPGNNLNGYSLLMATPYKVITNAIKEERQKIAINAILIAIIALFTAYFSSSILLNSMGKLQEGLKTIADGDFRKRMDDSPIAEFSSMIGSLNNTMYQLGELKVAKSVQETLLPDKGLSGEDWELYGTCRTATDLGGDHIDWLQLADGRVLIIVGDVTGHGIAPAMVQASMKVWLALHAETAPDAVSLVKEINRLHISHGAKRFNMTAWFGYYTPSTGELEFTSAGHPYPILLKEDGSVEMIKLPGMPIGSTLRIRLKGEKITLAPGSSLILYTDGFAEIKSPTGQLLGFDGFANICASTKGMDVIPAIEHIFEKAAQFGKQNDDQTVVILRRKQI